MFEAAELSQVIDKKTYEAQLPALREALLTTQYDVLRAARFPVLILIAGVDGAGKSETVNALLEWMDPRHIRATAFGDPSDEEAERPPMWRYWRALPPKGRIGVFFGSWYSEPIERRVAGLSKRAELLRSLEEIRRTERMLSDEGVLILKLWFHLPKKAQKARLKALAGDPLTAWRVTDADWARQKRYDDYRAVEEEALAETSTAEAPWLVVDGYDPRRRGLVVGNALLRAMRARLDGAAPAADRARVAPAIESTSILRSLDLSKRLEKADYEKQLAKHQRRLALLTRHPRYRRLSPILVFEGQDAAGKGGAIRRLTYALDARIYQVVPIAAPTEEERAQPYLWRFWRHAPRDGHAVIFDRSWYGRVLVERVEGFCAPSDWMRAYDEINDFERQLVQADGVVCKFWLQVSPEEQLRRFHEREALGWKRFKLTDEDWRNRGKAGEYERAAGEMIERTSTRHAPWTLVEAEDKAWGRVKVLRAVCEAIESRL